MMTSKDVLRVLHVLAGAGVDVWVDGGWGVDALLGEQTRPHNDLDIALKHDDVSRFMEAMRAAGYGSVRVDPGGGPMNFVVFDDQAHEVDVHLVDLSATRTSERGVGVYGPNGLEYEVGCLDGVGKIDGRQVACCTAESQIASHVGYELGETDLQDVKALRQRFGLSASGHP